jgi:hypothetical protein
MKKIKIKSEKQDNGLWGTPMNCYFMNSMSPIFDNRKHLLFSAILIAFAEEYNECSFRLDMMSDDGFLISINESLYNKKYKQNSFYIKYKDYEVNGNILYLFDNDKERLYFLRNKKLKKLKYNYSDDKV